MVLEISTFLYLSLLSFIQGITEFLPISSSAHLLVLPHILDVSDQGIIIDVAAHIGSLIAVCYFYRKDIMDIIKNLFSKNKEENQLFFKVSIAFIPLFLLGIVMYFGNFKELRNPKIVIYTSLIFGILLYIADIYGSKKRDLKKLTYLDAFFIGLTQILSVIPGVSRSGSTMTMAMFCGQKRTSAVKFAFLLSIPTISLVGLGGIVEFISSPITINVLYLLYTIVLSFIFSLFAIKFMIKWIEKSSFKIFAIYRILFAILLFFILK